MIGYETVLSQIRYCEIRDFTNVMCGTFQKPLKKKDILYK